MAITYEAVTDWQIASQATNTGSNKWLGAACRIVQASDSTSSSFHLYGEYSFYQWYQVSGSGTNNVYKYLHGVDTSRFATTTPYEAISLSASLTYPCVRGTVRRVELGTYGNDVTVTTPAFDCGWNGTTYSNSVVATYTTPSAVDPTALQVNKVVVGSQTLIDLSADTVTAATLLAGITAHDKNGASILGTFVGGDDVDIISNSTTHQHSQSGYSYTCIKFDCGLLIACFSQNYTQHTGSAYNNAYYFAQTFNLPSAQDSNAPAFIKVPYVVPQVRASTGLPDVTIYSLNATQAQCWIFADAATIPAGAVDFIAIGFWK